MALKMNAKETPYERLARKVAECRALAAELRYGAAELESRADYWAAVNSGE